MTQWPKFVLGGVVGGSASRDIRATENSFLVSLNANPGWPIMRKKTAVTTILKITKCQYYRIVETSRHPQEISCGGRGLTLLPDQ